MEKFYNNPAWRRIRGLRSFGILALSVAFCLTGLLALSSCDLEFWEDDDEAEVEPMLMRGFFISADETGDATCSNEDVDVYLEGDESTGKLDVTIVGAGAEFAGGKAKFKHVGQKLIDGDGNKTIVTAYVTADVMENFAHPGSYYLAKEADESMFTGYWVGHLYRGDHTVVLCPYVLVPRMAIETEGSGCEAGKDAEMVHMDLQPYLTKNEGMDLRACSNVFDSDGKVDPQPRME